MVSAINKCNPIENQKDRTTLCERSSKAWLESEQLRRIYIRGLDSNYFQNYYA